MALKDWEKVKDSKYQIVYRTKEETGGGLRTLLYIEKLIIGKWGIWLSGRYENIANQDIGRFKVDKFKSRTQALRFAKSYMRSHDR